LYLPARWYLSVSFGSTGPLPTSGHATSAVTLVRPHGKFSPGAGSMMPTDPSNHLWCPRPVNMIRRLPGIARASVTWSGQTLWLPQKAATFVPSGLVVHRLWTRHRALSVYSHLE
jgi:hypothetical protein